MAIPDIGLIYIYIYILNNIPNITTDITISQKQRYYCTDRLSFIENYNNINYCVDNVYFKLYVTKKIVVLKTNQVYRKNLQDIISTICDGWGLDKSQIQYIGPAEVVIKLTDNNLVTYINTVISLNEVAA